ncbi:MAG: metal-dependent hydrolase [Paenibacillaceae bacterium]|nr:metal-dependent hydrolase [Paenibacillaceae bacterium]
MNFAQVQKRIKPPSGQFAVAWTGQAGFSFKSAEGAVIHVDPFLSDVCSRYIGYHRAIDPPVEIEHIRGDYFLFTHEHRDHLDSDSVPIIAANNPGAVFAGPPACVVRLLEIGIPWERIRPIARGGKLALGDVGVSAVLAYHTDDSIGFVLDFAGAQVYISGDTTYSDELIGAVSGAAGTGLELMMVCINGRLGCMNIPDAARLTAHLQPRVAIPMHVDMFVENTADAGEYVRLVQAYSGTTQAVKIQYGEWYLYGKEHGLCLEEEESA